MRKEQRINWGIAKIGLMEKVDYRINQIMQLVIKESWPLKNSINSLCSNKSLSSKIQMTWMSIPLTWISLWTRWTRRRKTSLRSSRGSDLILLRWLGARVVESTLKWWLVLQEQGPHSTEVQTTPPQSKCLRLCRFKLVRIPRKIRPQPQLKTFQKLVIL